MSQVDITGVQYFTTGIGHEPVVAPANSQQVLVDTDTDTLAPDDAIPSVIKSGARIDVLNGASVGVSSDWLPISSNPERFAYQLDSGSASTQYTVDISADGITSLGQAFTGVWASTTAYITPPIMFSNPQARYFRVTVVSGGPLSVSRGY